MTPAKNIINFNQIEFGHDQQPSASQDSQKTTKVRIEEIQELIIEFASRKQRLKKLEGLLKEQSLAN